MIFSNHYLIYFYIKSTYTSTAILIYIFSQNQIAKNKIGHYGTSITIAFYEKIRWCQSTVECGSQNRFVIKTKTTDDFFEKGVTLYFGSRMIFLTKYDYKL